ncbi:MAG: LD-carboxypeptidase [Xanthomonadaceae bacterium]|nr:LD-carboxypeptidase [Xanthomonadaceae bacterium]
MKLGVKNIAIVAPSSVVARNELKMGLETLKQAGFIPKVYGGVLKKHLYYAGDTATRLKDFLDAAYDPTIDVVWAARGGYGAIQLLPLLAKETEKRGLPPHKLYIGYSDSTALLEFTRTRWNWSTLHAVMPGHRGLLYAQPRELRVLYSWIRGMPTPPAWIGRKLKWLGEKPRNLISGEMTGGNLCLVNDMVGTEFSLNAKGKIVFLEDLSETAARLDRMVHHLIHAKFFEGVKAVVLGSFTDCVDKVPGALKYIKDPKKRAMIAKSPRPMNLEKLRPQVKDKDLIAAIFSVLTEEFKIPVAQGLPCGHGGDNAPLPMGAKYDLSPDGDLAMRSWSWIR